jgi:hypothetical protein
MDVCTRCPFPRKWSVRLLSFLSEGNDGDWNPSVNETKRPCRYLKVIGFGTPRTPETFGCCHLCSWRLAWPRGRPLDFCCLACTPCQFLIMTINVPIGRVLEWFQSRESYSISMQSPRVVSIEGKPLYSDSGVLEWFQSRKSHSIAMQSPRVVSIEGKPFYCDAGLLYYSCIIRTLFRLILQLSQFSREWHCACVHSKSTTS